MKRGFVVAVGGMAIVVAGLSGCSSEDKKSETTGETSTAAAAEGKSTVTIDGTDQAVQGTIVYEPCAQGGLAAVDTAGRKIRVRWRGPSQAQGSPVIGGGAVWVTDYQGGTLYELDQATGAIRDSLGLRTTLPHFSSMSMTGSHAFLGTMEGVIAVGGV